MRANDPCSGAAIHHTQVTREEGISNLEVQEFSQHHHPKSSFNIIHSLLFTS